MTRAATQLPPHGATKSTIADSQSSTFYHASHNMVSRAPREPIHATTRYLPHSATAFYGTHRRRVHQVDLSSPSFRLPSHCIPMGRSDGAAAGSGVVFFAVALVALVLILSNASKRAGVIPSTTHITAGIVVAVVLFPAIAIVIIIIIIIIVIVDAEARPCGGESLGAATQSLAPTTIVTIASSRPARPTGPSSSQSTQHPTSAPSPASAPASAAAAAAAAASAGAAALTSVPTAAARTSAHHPSSHPFGAGPARNGRVRATRAFAMARAHVVVIDAQM